MSDKTSDFPIAFVLPDTESFHKLPIHFGIAYLSAVLKTHGFTRIKFFTVTSAAGYASVVSQIAAFRPAVVGFTSVQTQFHNVIALSAMLKRQCPSAVLVCGGTYPTIYPECLKEAADLDGIFRGECEQAFLSFVQTIRCGGDYRRTNNFCYYDRAAGRLVQNDLLPLVSDLDTLGHADKTIFNFQNVIASYGGIAPFMFNRGCPYNCAFCSNHALASVYGRNTNTTRRRSVASCVGEIEEAGRQYLFRAVHIWDDLFTSDRAWLYDFLDQYKRAVGKPFMCTTRSNLCDDELFLRLKRSGCYKVHMSLESGNDFIRNQVMKRNISREKVIVSFRSARKHGIRVNASSIIGLPFETESMIRETVSLLGALGIEDVGVNVFYPYRGTRLREVCEQFGMITQGDEKAVAQVRERRESVLHLPHISKERLNYYCEHFEFLVRKAQGGGALLEYCLRQTVRACLHPRLRRLLTGNRIPGVKTRLAGLLSLPFWRAGSLWLYRNRHLRMDANQPMYDARRRDFHKDRYRFAADYLKRHFPSGARVLDAACGTGYGAQVLKTEGHARVCGVDICPQAVAYASRTYPGGDILFMVDDVTSLSGQQRESFDAVVSFETIEHLKDPFAFLKRLQELLKPQGVLILSTPNQWGKTRDHYLDYDYPMLIDHVSRYFSIEATYVQNSGCADLWINRGAPRRIVPADESTIPSAECFITVCRKDSQR